MPQTLCRDRRLLVRIDCQFENILAMRYNIVGCSTCPRCQLCRPTHVPTEPASAETCVSRRSGCHLLTTPCGQLTPRRASASSWSLLQEMLLWLRAAADRVITHSNQKQDSSCRTVPSGCAVLCACVTAVRSSNFASLLNSKTLFGEDMPWQVHRQPSEQEHAQRRSGTPVDTMPRQRHGLGS